MTAIIANALAVFGFSGFIFGQLVGIRMPALNDWKLSPLQHVRLGLFFGLIYLCVGIVFGAAAAVMGIAAHVLFGVSVHAFTQVSVIFCVIFISYFIMKWTRLRSAFLRALSSMAKGAVFLFVFLEAFYIYERYFPLSLSVFGLLFTPIIYIFIRRSLTGVKDIKASNPQIKTKQLPVQGSKAESYDTKTKILFIGLDAADWRMIDPLIDEGKLPSLAKLKSQGFCAQADTITPTSSPRIWTSIATSKEPKDHGIIDWQKTVFAAHLPPLTGEPSSLRFPKGCGGPKIVKWLLRRKIVKAAPSTSQSRKCKAFWNVLSDFGKKSATVGWLFSWPAEKVKGLSVSWYAYPFEEAANVLQRFSSTGLKSRTYPEDFMDKIKDLVVSQKDLKEDELRALNIPTIKIDYDKVRFADQISPWYLAKDKTFSNITGFILDNHSDLDVVSVFLSGIDATSHTYWTFLNKEDKFKRLRDQILSISDDPEFKRQSQGFDKCIELYYQYVDGLIGKLLSKIDKDWTVVITSDHGFRYDGTGHSKGSKGVAILYGKNIKSSEERGRISVYDIAPTLLALTGLPIARDLKGRVIKEAISDDFFKDFPLRYVDTYEGAQSRQEETVETPKEVEQGLTRRLRALGYID